MIKDVLVTQLSNVIMDFECAARSAVHTVLPQVTCSGCHFHWTQAIWREVQSLELAADCMEKSQKDMDLQQCTYRSQSPGLSSREVSEQRMIVKDGTEG